MFKPNGFLSARALEIDTLLIEPYILGLLSNLFVLRETREVKKRNGVNWAYSEYK